MRRFLPLLLFCLLLGGYWWYANRPFYDEALFLKANQGDPKAEYAVGTLLHEGDRVPRDRAKAFHWFQKSAQKGNADAQTQLGYYYEKGFVHPPDPGKAIAWYEKASEQGNPYAQYRLSIMHLEAKNYKEAAHWCKQSAAKGFLPAEETMGYLYYYGYGVPQDYRTSHHWTKKAADKGSKMGMSNLAELYMRGIVVPKDIHKALDLYKKAAGVDSPYPAANVGYIYAEGLIDKPNLQEARQWYFRVMAMKDLDHFIELSNSFKTGDSTVKDLSEAYLWAYVAHRLKHPKAQEQLEMLEKEVSPEDKVKALQRIDSIQLLPAHLSRAAALGYSDEN